MTNLLLMALAMMPVTNDEWELKNPFKEKLTQQYEVLIYIDMGGQEMDVEITAELKIDKKTEKGFSGTYGFTEIFVAGDPQDSEVWPVEFKSNGVLKSLDADEGPGMRRMFLPFFIAYPDKSVSVGDTWKYADSEDDKLDGHMAVMDYKVISEEKVGKKDALKIEFNLKEIGSAPMTGKGHFWVDRNGNVLKFKFNLEGWPVPIADDQVFAAEVSGEIID